MSCSERRAARAAARRFGRLAAFACAALAAMPAAHATLGSDAASIAADEARLQGVRKSARALRVAAQVQAHEITMADGSSVREFVSADGVVFAVAWHTRSKPRLEPLLGEHAPSYAAAAGEAMRQPRMRRSALLQRGDLVVEASGHLNSFVGRAYLRSRVPAGVSVDELR